MQWSLSVMHCKAYHKKCTRSASNFFNWECKNKLSSCIKINTAEIVYFWIKCRCKYRHFHMQTNASHSSASKQDSPNKFERMSSSSQSLCPCVSYSESENSNHEQSSSNAAMDTVQTHITLNSKKSLLSIALASLSLWTLHLLTILLSRNLWQIKVRGLSFFYNYIYFL